MPATFATETVGAIATKVFIKTQPKAPWAAERPLLQIMSTNDLNNSRLQNFEMVTPITNTFGKAEAWKWPVDMYALSNGGSYSRGGSFTFASEDTLVYGSATPFFYQQPVEVPITDIDVHASAADNENAIAYVVSKMNNAKHKLGQLIAGDIVAASTAGTDITTILELIDATGTAVGINQGTHAAWLSPTTPLASARLTIRTLARQIRDIRRNKMAKLDLVVCGSAVHQFLVDEAEALNLPMFDIVEVFGRDPQTQEPRLKLEVSHSVIKIEGAPVVVDTDLDTTAPGTVLGISTDDLMLYGASASNFSVEGFEKVNLSAGKDAQRAQIKWAGFWVMPNRATHFKYTGAKTS